MPLYIAKSGDLDRCYRCLTHWLTHSLTTLKDSATQLLTKYKSGALVTQLNPTSKQPWSLPRERSEYMKQYDYMIILCDHMNMPERLTIRKSDRELKSQVYTAKTLPWERSEYAGIDLKWRGIKTNNKYSNNQNLLFNDWSNGFKMHSNGKFWAFSGSVS